MCQELYIPHITKSWQQPCNQMAWASFSWDSERWEDLPKPHSSHRGAWIPSWLCPVLKPMMLSPLYQDLLLTALDMWIANPPMPSGEQSSLFIAREKKSGHATNEKADAIWECQKKFGGKKTEMLFLNYLTQKRKKMYLSLSLHSCPKLGMLLQLDSFQRI